MKGSFLLILILGKVKRLEVGGVREPTLSFVIARKHKKEA